jgi:hypothetical protein
MDRHIHDCIEIRDDRGGMPVWTLLLNQDAARRIARIRWRSGG